MNGERWNMASWSDFRRVADDVRNWGRWGDADEIGTLNLITAEKVANRPRAWSSMARSFRWVSTSARRVRRAPSTIGRTRFTS